MRTFSLYMYTSCGYNVIQKSTYTSESFQTHGGFSVTRLTYIYERPLPHLKMN